MSKIKCMICGEEFERINYSHIQKHKITFEEYCDRFPDAPLVSEELKKRMAETHIGRTKENHEGTRIGAEKQTKQTGELNSNWRGGISFEPYCEKFDNDLKERIREYFGRYCYVCGKNEEDNGCKLSVHHVTYNKDTCCDYSKPLFVPLCQSCHMKTLKNRKYWEEFFTISLKCITKSKCFYTKEEMGGEK